MSKLRIYHVEVTLPEEVDEENTWREIGRALYNEGFEDFIYGGSEILEDDYQGYFGPDGPHGDFAADRGD